MIFIMIRCVKKFKKTKIMSNKIFPFLDLIRLWNPTGIVLLYIPCAFGVLLGYSGPNIPIYYLFVFFLGAIFMRSAGCIINDLWDREIDAKVERTKNRPLVTGSVSIKEAYIYLAILLSLSLLILISLPVLAIQISFFAFFLTILYPYMKRITFFPQLFLGITYNIGLIIGYVTVSNSFDPIILIAYAGFIFWTLTYDTIYAFLDIEYDKKIGVKSLAIILEHRDYKAYLYFFASIFICFCIITEIIIKPGYYIFMNILPFSCLYYLIYSLDIKNEFICKERFAMNSIIGWLMILVLHGSVHLH